MLNVNRGIGILKHVRNIVPKDSLMLLYQTMIDLILDITMLSGADVMRG